MNADLKGYYIFFVSVDMRTGNWSSTLFTWY